VRFCEAHWGALREAVLERGLSRFIAADTRTLMAKLEAGKGTHPQAKSSSFEPLFSAFLSIMSRFVSIGAEGALEDHNPDVSPRCPLCFANQEHKAVCTQQGCSFTFDSWIAGAADEQLERAKSLGLLGQA